MSVEAKPLAEATLCNIEIFKNGNLFMARSQVNGTNREYKSRDFEDMLMELVVDLQEEIQE